MQLPKRFIQSANFYFFFVMCQTKQKAFSYSELTPTGGEEKMQTYLAPNKNLAIKKQRPNVFAFCALA